MMQRAMISRRIAAVAMMVILTATTIPVVSGFSGGSDRAVMPLGCPPSC